MRSKGLLGAVLAMIATLSAPAALAQGRTDPAILAEQRAAIAKLDKLRGEWRGSVVITTPGGKLDLVQTERVGPMLGGLAMVIEGRAYDQASSLVFNAFAIISYDTATDRYQMDSWSDGHHGQFAFAVTDSGFEWTMPMPSGASIQYRAAVADGKWTETGSFVRPGAPPVEVARLAVERLGETSWPAAGFVTPAP